EIVENDNCDEDPIRFATQRLRQILITFDIQWSKQTNLPLLIVHGHLGSNKRTLVQYACRVTGYHCHTVSSQLLTGDSAAATLKRIENALQTAIKCAPCVLLLRNFEYICKITDIDNDDSIITNGIRQLIQNIQISTLKRPVLIIGLLTKLQTLNERLLSLFSYTVQVPELNIEIRKKWIVKRLSNIPLSDDFSIDMFLAQTKGWQMGELEQLVHFIIQACSARNKEKMIDPSEWSLNSVDFDIALKKCHSSKLAGQRKAMIPSVHWNDIGGLEYAKKEILNTIQLPLLYPDLFGDIARTGVLLYGPPGVGKTLLAKGVATELSLNFLSVRGPELLNMYVGQSEQNIRDLFHHARLASPCVLFFDELDSLAPMRGRSSSDSSGVSDRLVSQLLTEIDALNKTSTEQDTGKNENVQIHHVFVIGATNRPDLLDESLLRPGRFDKLIYIGVSNLHEDRMKMFDALTQKFNISDNNFDKHEFVKRCPLNMTGADFYAIASNAYLNAIQRSIKLKVDSSLQKQNVEDDESKTVLLYDDFQYALEQFRPSIDKNDLKQYERLQDGFS
ncbi:unnamed protein product, partial [Didymodactylos carnosus]